MDANDNGEWLRWVSKQFQSIAGDDKGIDLEEFKVALQVKESFFAGRFFALFDSDGSGTISLGELLEALKLLIYGSETEKLQFLFQVYDVDGSGSIERGELRTVLKSCLSESSISLPEQTLDDLTIALFESADTDKSGSITFEELRDELEHFPEILENLTISAASWLSPPPAPGQRHVPRGLSPAYWHNHRSELLVLAGYAGLNAALFASAALRHAGSGPWVPLARACGQCLNFNCAFIVVLMLRRCLTWLRATWVARILPLDQNVALHRLMGYAVAVLSVAHTGAHVANFVRCSWAEDGHSLWEYLLTTRPGLGWVHGSAAPTGLALQLLVGLVLLCSSTFVRRSGHFEVTHLVVGRPPSFHYRPGDYVYLNIPAIAKYEWHPFTISSAPEQSGTLWLHIRSLGQWTSRLYEHFRLQHPLREHPDHRPELLQAWNPWKESRLWKRLQKCLLCSSNLDQPVATSNDEMIEILSYTPVWSPGRETRGIPTASKQEEVPGSLGETHKRCNIKCYIDGPYGTCTRGIFTSEHAVLIGAGIGITPFASILQSIVCRYHMQKQASSSQDCALGENLKSDTMKLQKVDFIWINRDQKSFEWFISLLTQLEIGQATGDPAGRFLELHLFMTSALNKHDMKATGLQMALDLLAEKEKKDSITGLRTRTQPGRPDWDKLFQKLAEEKKGKVHVFFCGSPALAKVIKVHCEQFSFRFFREHF